MFEFFVYVVVLSLCAAMIGFVEMGPGSAHRSKMNAMRRETDRITEETWQMAKESRHDRKKSEIRRIEDEIAWAEKMFGVFTDPTNWGTSISTPSSPISMPSSPSEDGVFSTVETARQEAIASVIRDLERHANHYPVGSWQRARFEIKSADLKRRAKEA